MKSEIAPRKIELENRFVELENLTPHEIRVYDKENTCIYSIPSSGIVPRVVQDQEAMYRLNDLFEVKKTYFKEVIEMPDPKPNTVYIVSLVVGQALKNLRHDIVVPDSGPKSVIRDENGQVKGVRWFHFF